MVKDSLGLLEVAGLLGAITASDAMVKAANVRLIGIEKTRGLGWMTVKVAGDVAAVEAAVQTGVALTKGMNLYVAHKVIPRPAEGLVDSFNDDFTDRSDNVSADTKVAENSVDNESVKTEVITSVGEKPVLVETAVEVLDEIVSTIVDTKSSKSTDTKRTTPKKKTKKK